MRVVSIALALALAGALLPAVAQNKDPTPRRGLSPLDRAKVKHADAQFRRGIGVEQTAADTTVSGRPGEQSCNTSVGTTNIQAGPGTRQSAMSNKNDSVVVVRGDVINVCR